MIGLFSAPAEMRAPSLAVTPVRLKYAVGNSAALCSRTYCSATRARNFPTVICGFFFNASASACFLVKEVPDGIACIWLIGFRVAEESALPDVGDCPAAGVETIKPSKDQIKTLRITPPLRCFALCDARSNMR